VGVLGGVRKSLIFCSFAFNVLYASSTAGESPEAPDPAPIQITTIGAFNSDDTRHLYEVEVMRLIMEKTAPEFGFFSLQEAKGMTHSRAVTAMAENIYPNFVRSFGYEKEMLDDRNLKLIPFPVWRGLLGYRTCFVSKRVRRRFAKANTSQALKAFTHGQGTGWIDNTILEYNGYKVTEVSSYTGLFKMTAENRFDLFCRGASEVREEYEKFIGIKGLAFDRSKAFYYPFPHFFFTHKSNTELIARITRGIEIVTQDGSFEALWNQYHRENIEFVRLDKREIIQLENPLMKDFDIEYEHLIYRP